MLRRSIEHTFIYRDNFALCHCTANLHNDMENMWNVSYFLKWLDAKIER